MSLNQLPHDENIAGKKILMRVDFNVPIKDGAIAETNRIDLAIVEIQNLLKRGAKIILISHIGSDGEQSLRPVYEYFKSILPITFVKEVIGPNAQHAIHKIQDGECVMLENLRIEKGEKENDEGFARALAAYGDIYINEAFPASHRLHASIVGVPKYLPSYAGSRFCKEVAELTDVIDHPDHPFVFILGGAKFSTKLPLITKFLNIADTVFITGALANQFFKTKGYSVGESMIDEGHYNLNHLLDNSKLILPEDVLVSGNDGEVEREVAEIKSDEKIVDIGAKTLEKIIEKVKHARLILWNGPTGIYEEGYKKASEAIMLAMAHSTGKSVIGGGDTGELVGEMNLWDKLSFVSTGGGATLEFLARGTLPGIEALETQAK